MMNKDNNNEAIEFIKDFLFTLRSFMEEFYPDYTYNYRNNCIKDVDNKKKIKKKN